MLLTGTHVRTLDDKKRFVLPKRIRETLGDPETLFAAPGPDQCIWLFTLAGLEQFAGKLDHGPRDRRRSSGLPATLFRPDRRG